MDGDELLACATAWLSTEGYVDVPLIGEVSDPWSEYELKLRNLCSFTAPHMPWIKASFGATANCASGPVETGKILAGCERWFAQSSPSLGRIVPGRRVSGREAMA